MRDKCVKGEMQTRNCTVQHFEKAFV